MADQRTMAELLRAPTEGYAEAIVAWGRYKDLLHACLHHGFTELHQLDTFYNALKPADQDSLNSAASGNLLERRTQDVLTIIENKSKQTSDVTTAMTSTLKQFQATPPSASVKAVEEICVTSGGAHPYYQCLTVDGNTFPEFRDNIQGYVSTATVNYNRSNSGYRPLGVANQIQQPSFAQPNVHNNQNRFSQPQGYNPGNNFNQDSSYQALIQQNQVVPLSEFEKIKKMNEINIKAMQTQINNNMMASFFQMNTASTSSSGPLPSNTIANPKGKLKAITTRSGHVLDGPFVPMPLPFINPGEDERIEETLTDPELDEFTIKVPPPLSKMSRDVLTVGSTMRIPLLYRGEYLQWVEKFMNYLKEQTDGEAMINCIKNGDQPLPRVTQVSIAGTSSTEQPPLKDKSMWSDQEKKIQKIDRLESSLLIQGLPNDIYSIINSNKTAKELWDALSRYMLGFEYGEQDRKPAVLYEYEMFKANEGELLLDTYIRYLQWKQYASMMRENKNLMDINIDAIYNNLKQNQRDVNDAMGLKKKIVVVTFDPLALIAEKKKMRKRKEKVVVSLDSEGSDADDFSELKKITALLTNAFNRRKFYSKPTNNNLRTSSTS
nr:reverse transcriptase domain-containing protein [Tanacetum cinerariifolium]